MNNMKWNVFFYFLLLVYLEMEVQGCCWLDLSVFMPSLTMLLSGSRQLSKLQMTRHVEKLSWIKLVIGFFKLNVYCSRTRTGEIGAGGVIRDHTEFGMGGSW